MELRPYQQTAVERIHGEWDAGRQKTLLVLPTGTGKTITFAKVAEDQVRARDRVLILAHRGELLDQAADKMKKATGLNCSIEKAEQSCLGSWERVTVGSIQSLAQETRLAKFSRDHFQTIIVDEAHHALSDTYQRVLTYFGDAKVLGVTATPDRGDMRNLGQFFESLAFEYKLPQAIRDGYLCPIKARTIPLKIDLSKVKVQNGDFSAGDLGSALDPYLEQIATEMEQFCQDRKTVVFLPLVATSQKFRDILNAHGFKAAEVNGNSSDRSEVLEDFSAGKYNVLCNSMLLTEGWDCPDVDCIIVLRPTKVRSLYCQMVGRGTRISSNKDHLLLLDFLWHTERHELCHPAYLIAETEEVAKRMTKDIDESGEAIDIEEAEETAQAEVIQDREAALAEKLAAMRKKKAKLVDPLQFQMSILDEDLINYTPTFVHEMAPASSKQLAYIEKMGLLPDTIQNAGHASMIINKLMARADAGLATPKQIRQLEQRGFLHVGQWTKEQATKMIGRIANNHWRTPFDIDPATYEPR